MKASETRHEVKRPNLKHGLHTLNKALAVATIFRDKESLEAERQMERGS